MTRLFYVLLTLLFSLSGSAIRGNSDFRHLGIVANTPMFSSNLGSGGSRASAELLNSMRAQGRTITIATEGSEELRFLNAVGAEASVGGPGRK